MTTTSLTMLWHAMPVVEQLAAVLLYDECDFPPPSVAADSPMWVPRMLLTDLYREEVAHCWTRHDSDVHASVVASARALLEAP